MINELGIEAITSGEILDPRGNLTVEVEVYLTRSATGRAAVSSGASTGKFEAAELRGDGNRYDGLGVRGAIGHVNTVLSETVLFESTLDQRRIDRLLLKADETESKGKLGANAILGVFIVVTRTVASGLRMPFYRYLGGTHASVLPVPTMNVLNRGKHASNTVDLQEFMIMPFEVCCFTERLRMCAEVYHTLKKLLKEEGYSAGIGDEGGFAPDLKDSEAVLELLVRAMEKSGLKPGTDMKIAIDAASNELYDEASGMYLFPEESRIAGKKIRRSTQEMVDYCRRLADTFPICSIENGLQEEDWEGWKILAKELEGRIQLVGDDLFVTDTKRLSEGIESETGNTIPVKVNQIGTLSESFKAIEMTKRTGFGTIISHHSGETEDSIIAGIAVAVNTG